MVSSDLGFKFFCLSTDAKPTTCVYGEMVNGAALYEIDTGNTYFYRQGEGWFNKDANNLVSISATHSGTVYEGYAWATEDPKTNYTVTATYEDDTTATVTDFSISYPAEITAAGSKTVTVIYAEGGVKKTTTVSVTVTAAAISSISITTNPTKLAYTVGETFEPAGMVVKVNLNDTRKSINVEYTPEDTAFTFNPTLTTALTTDDDEVNVRYTYKGNYRSADVSITVTEPEAEDESE